MFSLYQEKCDVDVVFSDVDNVFLGDPFQVRFLNPLPRVGFDKIQGPTLTTYNSAT